MSGVVACVPLNGLIDAGPLARAQGALICHSSGGPLRCAGVKIGHTHTHSGRDARVR